MRMVEEGSFDWPPKTILLPSGDQFGSSCCRPSLAISKCGLPPSAAISLILAGFSELTANSKNRIFFPSGDQRGSTGYMGGYVNCCRLLPSNLLRHSVPSG